ncbi:MAG: [Bacteroidales bacterium]|nr:[FeFe] hydrogenase H-cluster radical SAM maturase HydE [Bacteroidales bacterium]
MSIISDIRQSQQIDSISFRHILEAEDDELLAELRAAAQQVAIAEYGHEIYVRGLIEISNICKNNCYYCGIRRGNKNATRYRLSREQILDCCSMGHALGFRTFVLQGGEDAYYSDTVMCDIVSAIKAAHPDCAVTLSLGERSRASYAALREAGADRYLLRHETANAEHYAKLHPAEMNLANRKQCLFALRELGYQVGSGFMVGSPYQTVEHLYEDLLFLQQLQPAMIGIGPFLHHHDTPFANEADGSVERCLRMIAILRLLFPKALIPATTALGTAAARGRERGIQHGANVLMPNLSPVAVRRQYELYDNKICTGEEAAECRVCLARRIESIGYHIVVDRGDSKMVVYAQAT